MEFANNTTTVVEPGEAEGRLYRELMAGLTAQPKTINPKFFYNTSGSELFEQITRLPEYYPSRTEIQLLQTHAAEMARQVGDNICLIEPGAGNCEKVRYLLEALRPLTYCPMDIAGDFLQQAAAQLEGEFPWLPIYPLTRDFHDPFQLPALPGASRVVAFYPGSTIGNLEPSQAVDFLRRIAEVVSPQGGILLGVDLQKDPDILNAAYNDSQGITEQFNLNVLNHINELIGTDFELEHFSHRAFYNTQQGRIEMHLVSKRDQEVTCGERRLAFAAGETIHTENSYKYTLAGIEQLAEQAGLKLAQTWRDEQSLFSINYLAAP